MNVSLTPELVAFVRARVATGRYQTASEVVREALRHLQDREAEKKRVGEMLERAYYSSLEGEGIDGDEAFRSIRRRLAARVAETSFPAEEA